MKKIKIFVCFILLNITACKTDNNIVLIEQLKAINYNGKTIYEHNGKPFTGQVVDNQQKNNKIVNFFVDNGLLNGPYKEVNEKNATILETTYKNGMLHGSYKTFFESGTLQEELMYNAGYLEGVRKYYWPNGMTKEINEYKNGRLIYFTSLFFSNGKLRKKIYFNTYGKRDSIWTEYHINGTIKDSTLYSNGTLIETYQFDKNGIKRN
ncbi:MAG: toxin-antitoxin system YwqK family antitoxin [Flavobacteriaceae bacterium]